MKFLCYNFYNLGNWKYKIFEIAVTMVLVLWFVLFLAEKINLSTADIGRHIKNGEIILNAPWPEKMAVLNTNFYSYTENDFPFVNHHWLSGVVFYLIFILAGFKGLSVFYIFLCTGAFYLLFRMAKKEVGVEIASILSLLALPIITQRAEIRPEAFTYFFIAVFFYILWKWQKENGNGKILYILPVLMLVWVNLHVGFIFGFLLLGSFWIDELVKYLRAKNNKAKIIQLSIASFVSIIAASINPFFVKGLLYPLNIFRNYGYLVVENQSILFLKSLGMGVGLHFVLIKFLYAIAVFSFVYLFFRLIKDDIGKFPFHHFIILLVAGILSFLALRNFPIFALLFLPVVAYNMKLIFCWNRNNLVIVSVIVLILSSLLFWREIENRGGVFGIGLLPQANAAAEFYEEQKINGAIFNNYDIGGFLIFNLFPSEKLFVDNRPEAYSTEFFKKVYIPVQENNADWQKLDSKYNFNAIFFSHRDYTPWGQNFLVQRVSDPNWAPVFVDAYNIIFLKRNSQNSEIIKKYEIPKSNFGVRG